LEELLVVLNDDFKATMIKPSDDTSFLSRVSGTALSKKLLKKAEPKEPEPGEEKTLSLRKQIIEEEAKAVALAREISQCYLKPSMSGK
jgi:hypothetical protein